MERSKLIKAGVLILLILGLGTAAWGISAAYIHNMHQDGNGNFQTMHQMSGDEHHGFWNRMGMRMSDDAKGAMHQKTSCQGNTKAMHRSGAFIEEGRHEGLNNNCGGNSGGNSGDDDHRGDHDDHDHGGNH